MSASAVLPRLLPCLRYVFGFLAALTLLAGIALASLFLLPTARVWLLEQAIAQTSPYIPFAVRVEGLQSPSVDRWQLRALRLEVDGEVVARIDELVFNWQLAGLWRRQLLIDELSIRELRVEVEQLRALQSRMPTSAAGSSTLDLPLERLDIRLFKIDGAYIEADFLSDFPELQGVSALATLQLEALERFQLSLELQTQTPEPIHLQVDIKPTDEKAYAVRGSLQETAPGRLGRLLQLPAERLVDTRFDVELLPLDQDRLELRVNEWHLPVLAEDGLVSGRLLADSNLRAGELVQFQLSAAGASMQLQGHWSAGQIDMSLAAEALPLQWTRAWQSHLDSGTLSAELRIKGEMSAPRFSGRLDLSSHYDNQPLRLTINGSGNTEQSDIADLRAVWGDSTVTAAGLVDWSQQRSALSVKIDNLNLARLQGFGVKLPQDVTAVASTIEVELRGNLMEPDGSARVLFEGHFQTLPWSLKGTLQKKGSALLIESADLGLPHGQARIQGAIDILKLDSDLWIQAEAIPLQLLRFAAIELPADLSGLIEGGVKLKGPLSEPQAIVDAQAIGHYLDIPVALDVSGLFSRRQSQVRRMLLSTFDKPVLSATGHFDAETIDLKLMANRLPTRLMQLFGWSIRSGSFSAQMALTGSLPLPDLNGSMSYEAKLISNDDNGDAQARNNRWSLSATTLDQSYHLSSQFQRDDEAPALLQVTIPQQPYRQFLSDGGTFLPLYASMQGESELQMLSLLMDTGVHHIQGKLRAEALLRGDWNEPELDGALVLSGGSYHNPISGLKIDAIDCHILATQAQFSVQNCQASDGYNGQYRVQGALLLPRGDDAGELDISISATNAGVIRRPDLESQANGEIRLNGNFRELLASGTLNLAPLAANLDASADSDIPKIKITKVAKYAPEDSQQSTGTTQKTVVNLDLLVSASKPAFLRGKGIDVELEGRLRLRGTADKPRYEGEFKSVRGQFDVFGKKFNLSRGVVNFANSSIAVNIEGVYERRGQTVIAQLSGSGDDLKLKLRANPAMAEDQILTFILFGKTVQSISPLEAIQLAGAIQAYRDGGNAFFDPVGLARKTLAVDSLSIASETGEGGQNSVSIGIGKYLNERVYLELERTPSPSQPWKGSLEIELSPSLTLESSTGGATGIEGAELKWKKDY